MTINAEKILVMLQSEAIKVRESNDLKQIEEFYLEVQRFIKTEYEKLEELRTSLYIEALNGAEEGQVNNYTVSYKPLERFALDSDKLKLYISEKENVEISEVEVRMKNLVYSHSLTKPSLKLKALKN